MTAQPPPYMPTQAPMPPRRRRTSLVLWPLAGVVAAAAVVAVLYVTNVIPHGGGSTPPPAAPVPSVASFTMSGTYMVLGDAHNHVTDGQSCTGNGPDGSIIGPDTPVHVFDQAGHQIATGSLSGGTAIVNSLQTACQFAVTVDGVPDGLPSYGVEVGSFGVRQVSSTDAHQGFSLLN